MNSRCPHPDELGHLAAGRIREDALPRLERHLDTCPLCRAELDRLIAEENRFLNGLDPETDVTIDYLAPAETPGTLGRFADYEIESMVARGGMGTVFKARDTGLNRTVAIKVLARELSSDPGARERFLREARAAAAVVHDNIIVIHAVSEHAGLPYLVMPFHEASTLEAKVERDGPLDVDQFNIVALQLARGLAAAHSHGLIHRDVKPGNILLESGLDRVRISDFGLVRALEETSNITRPGMILGTPQFMAPEQIESGNADARSDLFSLGCVLYFMAAGHPPFKSDTLLGVLREISEHEPPPVHEINPRYPPRVTAVIDRLLRKAPNERIQSATELAERLEAIDNEAESGHATVPHRSRNPRRKPVAPRRTAKLAAAGILAVLLISSQQDPVVDRINPRLASAFNRPFHLAGQWGGYRTFQDAVSAIGGDDRATIRLRHNGSLDFEPAVVQGKSITFSAAPGFRPILVSHEHERPLITTDGVLVLEGLQFEHRNSAPDPPPIILSESAPFLAIHCRFANRRAINRPRVGHPMFVFRDCPRIEILNSDIISLNMSAVKLEVTDAMTNVVVRFRNNQIFCKRVLTTKAWTGLGGSVELHDNSIIGLSLLFVEPNTAIPAFRIEADRNALELIAGIVWAPGVAQAELPGPIRWRGRTNLFANVAGFVQVTSLPGDRPIPSPTPTLSAWRRDWDAGELGSFEAPSRLAGRMRELLRDMDSFLFQNRGHHGLDADSGRLRNRR